MESRCSEAHKVRKSLKSFELIILIFLGFRKFFFQCPTPFSAVVALRARCRSARCDKISSHTLPLKQWNTYEAQRGLLSTPAFTRLSCILFCYRLWHMIYMIGRVAQGGPTASVEVATVFLAGMIKQIQRSVLFLLLVPISNSSHITQILQWSTKDNWPFFK